MKSRVKHLRPRWVSAMMLDIDVISECLHKAIETGMELTDLRIFSPSPTIEYIGGRHSHVFWCAAKGCGKTVHRFLDKSDTRSTGNLRKHVGKCWGEDVLHQVFEFGNVKAAHEAVKSFTENRSITVAFE